MLSTKIFVNKRVYFPDQEISRNISPSASSEFPASKQKEIGIKFELSTDSLIVVSINKGLKKHS